MLPIQFISSVGCKNCIVLHSVSLFMLWVFLTRARRPGNIMLPRSRLAVMKSQVFYFFYIVLLIELVAAPESSVENYRVQNNKWDNRIKRRQKQGGNVTGDGYSSMESHNCPDVWFVWNDNTNLCNCGNDLNGIVNCDTATHQVSVLDCYCVTTDYNTQISMVGSCIFNCVNSTWFIDSMYHGAPSDCASLNRQGTLCGQCLDGYTVPAYSYEFKCIRCDSELENCGLYIAAAFIPLTVFIVITLVFRVNVLSLKLNMFVFAAQNLTMPILARVALSTLSQRKELAVIVPVKLIGTLYGIWNLDFLRLNVLPDICINVIPLHILVLDYLVALYPMIVTAILFTIVELYSFGFRPLVYVWKPFHYIFARFRRHWGIQSTIMDAFITFLFLSTTKFLSVSCDLLMGTRVFTPDGKLYSWNLYYDPSIRYFGREHLPYALLAIGILTLFVAFPTLLLFFYQFKACRKCLKKCQIQGTLLDALVDTFQKYYKNGTNGTWDCRWFAGFFILLKSLSYLVNAICLSEISYIFITILCIVGAIVIVLVEPYAEEYKVFNVVGAIVFLWQALFVGSLVENSKPFVSISTHYKSAMILSLVPLVYIILVVLHHLIRRFRGQKRGDGLTSSLPHRLLHSDQYRDSFGFIGVLRQSP